MGAELEGITGIWGIAESEIPTGLIIDTIEEASRSEKNFTRNHKGCRQGRAETDESVMVTVNAEVLADSTYEQKLGAALSLVNAVDIANLNAEGPGLILTDDVKRKHGREEWEKVTVDAELLPLFSAVPDGALLLGGVLLLVGGAPLVVGV